MSNIVAGSNACFLHTSLTLLSGQDIVMFYLAIGPLKKRKLRLKGHAVSFMIKLTIFISIHRPYLHVPGPVHRALTPV